MRFLIRLTLCSLAFCSVVPPASAQERDVSIFDIRAPVSAQAFDPTRFFPSRYITDRSSVRIVYTGDDYAWPVYAIAIAAGCEDDEVVSRNECNLRLTARMVRAPAPLDMDRPRQRGTHLLRQLAERGAATPPQIAAALAEVGTEWLEADVRACPGALSVLRRSAEASWMPTTIIYLDQPPTPIDFLAGLTMHADTVRVEFQQHARRSSYSGDIAEGTPTGWAVELATALEPCWRPATAPPPWSGAD